MHKIHNVFDNFTFNTSLYILILNDFQTIRRRLVQLHKVKSTEIFSNHCKGFAYLDWFNVYINYNQHFECNVYIYKNF